MKAGWKIQPLGEIGTLQRGFDLPKAQRTPGRFPLITSSGATDTHNIAKVKGPGVATGRSGSIGNVFYVKEDFWPLNTALYVKDFHGNEPKFVYYLLQLLDLGRFASGAGVPTLNRNDVHGELIPIPESLEEQQRIVAVLDEAFEGLARARAHAEANLQNARELFDNFTTGVFSNILDDHGQTTLEEVCEFITDGTHQTPKYFESGFLFLSAKNVKGGCLDWEDVKYIDEAQHIAMQKRLAPRLGDLLIRKNGAGYGGAALVDRDVIFDVYVSLAVLRPKKWILPEFLLQFANSSLAQTQFKDRIKGQGVPNLHLQEIRKVTLAIPKDVDTQHEIAEKLQNALEATRNLEKRYEQKIQDLDDLRQSLLQKAFAGELT